MCVEKAAVFFLGRMGTSSVYVGMAHHTIMDGLGLEELRRRVVSCDKAVRSPSYLDYARWQQVHVREEGASRPDLVGLTTIELAVASALYSTEVVTFRRAWPDSVLQVISYLPQPDRFPWLLQRLMEAASRFTSSPGEGLVVASVVGNHWIDTVGPMVSTVLYRWRPGMSFKEWKAHIVSIQSGAEAQVSLASLGLPTHPESRLPITPFMVTWSESRWWLDDIDI